jgi:hemerythrin-like metal-binding protein
MTIVWEARYEAGVAEVDEDHRRLVALINELDAVLGADGDLMRVGMIIDALVDYIHYHFGREEALMAGAGYDGAGDHAIAHTQLRYFLSRLVEAYTKRPSRETAARVRDYLQEWLMDHILVEDMKFAAAVAARAAA